MNVFQMLSHCACFRRNCWSIYFKKLLTEKPFKKNSHIAKEYAIVGEKILSQKNSDC